MHYSFRQMESCISSDKINSPSFWILATNFPWTRRYNWRFRSPVVSATPLARNFTPRMWKSLSVFVLFNFLGLFLAVQEAAENTTNTNRTEDPAYRCSRKRNTAVVPERYNQNLNCKGVSLPFKMLESYKRKFVLELSMDWMRQWVLMLNLVLRSSTAYKLEWSLVIFRVVMQLPSPNNWHKNSITR